MRVQWWLKAILRRADQARDAGRFDEAAAAYAAAAKIVPERQDIRIQCGNMLKDARRLAEAVDCYRSVLAQDPRVADAHLQMGHALKLMGRRAEAMSAYETVLEIDPAHRDASWELVQAGDPAEQNRAFASQLVGHGLETMLTLAAEMSALRARMDEIARILPDVAAMSAFPAEAYAVFRKLYDIPPPPEMEVPQPSLLVLVNADGADAAELHELVAAVVEQSAPTWRAVFLGVDPNLRIAIERLAIVDSRIALESRGEGESVAAAERRIARAAGEDGILFLAPGARMHRQCVAWFAAALVTSEAGVVTCDEEWTDGADGEVVGIEARGAFDPDQFMQANVFGETVAVRRSALEVLDLDEDADSVSSARSEILLGAMRNRIAIAHVPLPLVATSRGLDDGAEEDKRRSAHQAAVARFRQTAELTRQAPSNGESDGRITVIIATKNNAHDCEAMVESLFAQADDASRLSCLIVDNGTDRPDDLSRLEALERRNGVALLRAPGPFNWSYLNNRGAEEAKTPFIVFANDDMKMISAGWDHVIRSQLSRPEVGAVGAKLLYPDDTIQHAGVLFGWKGSVIHDGLHQPGDAPGPGRRWQTMRRVSAVTGAFFATRRDDFRTRGGFDATGLPIAYSDIDLALRLRKDGLAVVWTPDVMLYHYESKSRGMDHLDPERNARSLAERRIMENRWGREMFSHEPTISPIWVDATLPFRLMSPVAARRAVDFIRVSGTADARRVTKKSAPRSE
ncbi:tetratricopeptide repeat protein [Jiella marina]|uniref:tetratricopeptide repeat protein n=1 Tax=Jiella sp. LLJ827 TaxID=2917712 RepID=UPI0021014749|nr:glycosyltransferase [Jiella sp. LLJ827]MCQ0988468.1 glycosyltransferase [Jiella sp. LLJ827]